MEAEWLDWLTTAKEQEEIILFYMNSKLARSKTIGCFLKQFTLVSTMGTFYYLLHSILFLIFIQKICQRGGLNYDKAVLRLFISYSPLS